jgi:hypothetical protein
MYGGKTQRVQWGISRIRSMNSLWRVVSPGTFSPLKVNGLQGLISRKIELFITTGVRTSNPTQELFVCEVRVGSRHDYEEAIRSLESGRWHSAWWI